ncbi:MAG: acyltransferase [Acetobacter sp.]|nr:acyltransferase [Bacteroides sp.]MCM1341849.1 acyltransferase [Acetobacter sp.]MCM1434015.1 acyltransferase [Clostridiales bacterium]
MNKSKAPIQESKRNYGVDLLRMVAMMMVVALHTLSRSGLLTKTSAGSIKYETSWFLEIICYCAVDCFVLISGYVGLKTKFKLSRIANLWLQVTFYTVGLNLLMCAVNHNFSAEKVLHSFFPVINNTYWFFTQYFILSFFMPFINKLILSMDTKKLKAIFVIGMLFLSIVPMITYFLRTFDKSVVKDLFFENRGYSVIWLSFVYALGGIIKKSSEEGIIKNRKAVTYFLIFILLSSLTWLIHYICVNSKNSISHNFIVAYTSPLIILSAISLLMLFANLNIKSKPSVKLISIISPGVFSVYLIHSNPSIYNEFTKHVKPILEYRTAVAMLCVLFTVIFVFIVCSTADIIRSKLFKLFKIDKLVKKLDNTKLNTLMDL